MADQAWARSARPINPGTAKMSDARPLPDYLGNDDDEELVFDGAGALDDMTFDEKPAEEAAAPPVVQPGRAVRRGKKPADDAVDVVSGQPEQAQPLPLPAASIPASEEAATGASAGEPAGVASAPFPPHGAAPAGSTKPNMLLLAITVFALLSSLLSLGGLITVSRTLAHAEADRENAASQRAKMEAIPALVDRLNAASARLDAASQRYAATSPAGPPATLVDVRHELDLLKLALANRQPEGMGALSSSMHDGFSELSTRLDRLEGRGHAATPPQP
jgi:hypothetical protein